MPRRTTTHTSPASLPEGATLDLTTAALTFNGVELDARSAEGAHLLTTLPRLRVQVDGWTCSILRKPIRRSATPVWHAQAYVGTQTLVVYVGKTITFDLIVEKVEVLRARTLTYRAARPNPLTIKQIQQIMQDTPPDAVRVWLIERGGADGSREAAALLQLIDHIYPPPA